MSSKKQRYVAEDLTAAIEDVINGRSKNAAAKKYNIPRATIQFHMKRDVIKTKRGPQPILSEEEEDTLVKWIIDSCNKGFPRRAQDIILSVKAFLELNEMKNPFKNNTPGVGWYRAFLRRHPEISYRTSEAVTAASSCVSEKDIRNWFTQISQCLKDEGHFEILQDTTRVFNGDETSFLLNPTGSKVVGPKGAKNVYEIERGKSKTSITVMFSFSASGLMVPPMVIFPYQRIPTDLLRSVPDSWGIGRSESGWMRAEVFYEYIGNVFGPFIKNNNIKTPVILFVDGHKSHLTCQVSELCTQLGIVLVALYPNATRILQPADVAAFRPIKEGWRKGVLEWRNNHPEKDLTKNEFCPVLKAVLDKYVKPETLKNGFRACGLVPWNADAVDYTKCLGSSRVTTEANEMGEIRQLDYGTFSNMVGNELLQKFANIENECTEEHSNEFYILFRMWNEVFNKRMPQTVSATIQEDGPATEQQKQPSISTSNETTIVLGPTHTAPNISEVIESSSTSIIVREEADHTSKVNSAAERDEATLPGGVNADTTGDNSTPNQSTRPVKRKLFDTPEKQTCSQKLHEILAWPESPMRKGKRQTTRLPFVVSCEAWKTIQQEKATKKKEEEEKKLERKRKRDEKKDLKEQNAKTKRVESSQAIRPEIGAESMKSCKQGLCYSCARNIRPHKEDSLKCSMCNKLFHEKCVPKSHQVHIPEVEEDKEHFICHLCFKVNDRDSDDSLILEESE